MKRKIVWGIVVVVVVGGVAGVGGAFATISSAHLASVFVMVRALPSSFVTEKGVF